MEVLKTSEASTFYGVKIDVACSFFAVLSLFISASCVAMVVGPKGLADLILAETDFVDPWAEEGQIDMLTFCLVLVLDMACIAAFVFSALLVYGTETRCSGYLIAYLAYGSAVAVVSLLTITSFYVFHMAQSKVCLLSFIVWLFYVRMLYMVQQTAQLFRAEQLSQDRSPLLPQCKTA